MKITELKLLWNLLAFNCDHANNAVEINFVLTLNCDHSSNAVEVLWNVLAFNCDKCAKAGAIAKIWGKLRSQRSDLVTEINNWTLIFVRIQVSAASESFRQFSQDCEDANSLYWMFTPLNNSHYFGVRRILIIMSYMVYLIIQTMKQRSMNHRAYLLQCSIYYFRCHC